MKNDDVKKILHYILAELEQIKHIQKVTLNNVYKMEEDLRRIEKSQDNRLNPEILGAGEL